MVGLLNAEGWSGVVAALPPKVRKTLLELVDELEAEFLGVVVFLQRWWSSRRQQLHDDHVANAKVEPESFFYGEVTAVEAEYECDWSAVQVPARDCEGEAVSRELVVGSEMRRGDDEVLSWDPPMEQADDGLHEGNGCFSFGSGFSAQSAGYLPEKASFVQMGNSQQKGGFVQTGNSQEKGDVVQTGDSQEKGGFVQTGGSQAKGGFVQTGYSQQMGSFVQKGGLEEIGGFAQTGYSQQKGGYVPGYSQQKGSFVQTGGSQLGEGRLRAHGLLTAEGRLRAERRGLAERGLAEGGLAKGGLRAERGLAEGGFLRGQGLRVRAGALLGGHERRGGDAAWAAA